MQVLYLFMIVGCFGTSKNAENPFASILTLAKELEGRRVSGAANIWLQDAARDLIKEMEYMTSMLYTYRK